MEPHKTFYKRININGPFSVTCKQGEFLYTGYFETLFEVLEFLETHNFKYYYIKEDTPPCHESN